MAATKEDAMVTADESTMSLSLSFKDFRDGKLPPRLWGLSSLETLSLTGDALPALPPLIARLTSLTTLNLGNNELRDLPAAFGALAHLANLELSGNYFEALPACLSDLVSLRTLSLARNRLTSISGTAVVRLTRLETLVLAENQLVQVPVELAALQVLRVLNLTGNERLCALPPELNALHALEELLASRTALTEVPVCVYGLRNLRKLDISNSAIARFAEPTVGMLQMESLVVLNVSSNEIRVLPSELGRLPRLETFDASCNAIEALPDLSALAPTLKALVLRSNSIAELPDTVFRLVNLSILDVGYNNLAEMPTTGISKLPCLRSCVLFGNRFSGAAAPSQVHAIAITQEPDPPAEIIPKLWLGSYNSARNKHGLRERGVTHIVTVAALLRPPFPRDFKYHIVRVEDTDEADLASCFEQCIAFIDEGIEGGGSVLVHCAAGISRSATVVAAYLIARKQMTAAEALELVKQKRPIVCPNLGFITQLERFEKKRARHSNCKHQ